MGQQTPRHTSGTNKQPKRGMHECVWVRPVASDGKEGALNTRGRTAAGQKAQAGLIARAHKSDTRVAWQGGGRIEKAGGTTEAGRIDLESQEKERNNKG